MKTLFISAYKKSFISENSVYSISEKLPNNIAVVYSIQYKEIAEEIVKDLAKTHKIAFFGQIIGCSKPEFPKSTQAILLVGNGKFHAVSLAFENKRKLPVYIYDEGKFEKISESEINFLERKQKSAYLKYLNADKVGILISIKPGQERLGRALRFKAKSKKKKFYLFLSNNINLPEFENFPDIQSWVNSACPRMNFDYPFVNITDLENH